MTNSVTRRTDFSNDPVAVARSLLGQRFVRRINDTILSGRIVEVEAYLGAEDKAAHTYGGRRTARNEAMYLPGGHLYVYLIYGMHHCMNIVCGEENEGVAVLIRALEPEQGIDVMRSHRGSKPTDRDLLRGPARLTQAMQIDTSLNGIDLRSDTRMWIEPVPNEGLAIAAGPRIGIDYAADWANRHLRFWITASRYVSGSARQNRID